MYLSSFYISCHIHHSIFPQLEAQYKIYRRIIISYNIYWYKLVQQLHINFQSCGTFVNNYEKEFKIYFFSKFSQTFCFITAQNIVIFFRKYKYFANIFFPGDKNSFFLTRNKKIDLYTFWPKRNIWIRALIRKN